MKFCKVVLFVGVMSCLVVLFCVLCHIEGDAWKEE